MDSRVALDTAALRRLVGTLTHAPATAPDEQTLALVRIYLYIANPLVVPTVSDEIEASGDAVAVSWRNFHFDEVTRADESLPGCAKGKTETYLGYHPDPRDCHVVAEAECAKAETFLTVSKELLTGLAGMTEAITVTTPSEFWHKAQVPRGIPPRITPAPDHPLGSVAWWRW
jgi:hypothetical protein